VLYAGKKDFDAVAEVVAMIDSRIARHRRARVPVFTKALAPGLGFAEDPGDSDSFGMSRCRLVAEGLLRAHEAGLTAEEDRLRSVETSFVNRGLSLDEPYLNAGSRDDYRFRPVASRTFSGAGERTAAAGPLGARLLEAANSIAVRICDGAVWVADHCNWIGPVSEHGNRNPGAASRQAALGPDVYSGTSGVALFLAALCGITADRLQRRTALGAIRQAVSCGDRLPTTPGLYSGWSGVALASAWIGTSLAEPALIRSAAAIMRRMARRPCARGEFDLLSGCAGAIPALLVLRDVLGDDGPLDLAVRMGNQLARTAIRTRWGYSWRTPGRSTRHNLTGMSHGASGAGYALLELYHATGDVRFREAGLAAFRYERHWMSPSAGNWYDLRPDPGGGGRGNGERPCASGWCHGAPGIALARIRGYEITGDPCCRREAEIGLETTLRSVEAAIESGGDDFTLCHGLSGNSDVLLHWDRLPGAGTSHALLTQVGERIAEEHSQARLAGVRFPRPARPWGLMTGLAGTGYGCLRLRDPGTPSLLMLQRASLPVTSGAGRSSPPAMRRPGESRRSPRSKRRPERHRDPRPGYRKKGP
jgi:hypothetical protein